MVSTEISNSTTGTSASFSKFAEEAEKGGNLTVAFLGGSLTWGARASDPMQTSYRGIVSRKLSRKYPKTHFTFIDAAIGGTGAQLGAFRLDRDVLAYQPDLLFLDFTLNDGVFKTTPDTLAAQEAIIRRVISEAQCPLIQLFLAAREFVTEHTLEEMDRRTAHLEIARTYNVPCGDAIQLMRQRFQTGELDPDQVWPPESFDTCHPGDKGYALYAEAAWTTFNQALADQVVCRVPETMIYADTYLHTARVKLSAPSVCLPTGWRTTIPTTEYCGFDFLMTRWLDEVTVASNFTATSRTDTTPAPPAKPLTFAFHGTSVLLFGQTTPRTGSCKIIIDGEETEYNLQQLGANNTGRMVLIVAEQLDPDKEHTMQIVPLFPSPDKPQEIRIESICIAGCPLS